MGGSRRGLRLAEMLESVAPIDANEQFTWAGRRTRLPLWRNKLPITAVQFLDSEVLPTFEALGAHRRPARLRR